MIVNNFAEKNSILNQYIAEIRDVQIQKDRMRYRRNIARIGEIIAYEISKTMRYSEKEVITPLGEAKVSTFEDEVVLATILRAGIPLHQGLLNYFDKADTAFISAYRTPISEEEFEIEVDYCAAPSLDNKSVIICDPMLATGNSFVAVYKALQDYGIPNKLHLVFAIATEQALQFIEKKVPQSTRVWVGAIDNELTAQSYIVPGLGDAGDLAFGEKV